MKEIDKKEKEYFYIVFCDKTFPENPELSYVGVSDGDLDLKAYKSDKENAYLNFETFKKAEFVASNLYKEFNDNNLEYSICKKKVVTTTFVEEYRYVNNELVEEEDE